MSKVGQKEIATQQRLIALFTATPENGGLGYAYLGHWKDRPDNSNVEESLLSPWLTKCGYSPAQISAAIYRLRTEAGLTQAELAERMGTTQSAIARMEGGGTRPTLETLEKLAVAVGGELVVGVGENLSENRSIAKLVRKCASAR